jgi:hypothetical protein
MLDPIRDERTPAGLGPVEPLARVDVFSGFRFGEAALAMKFLDRAQLDQLVAVKRQRPERRMGELGRELGLLTDDEVRQVLLRQERRRQELFKPAPAPEKVCERCIMSSAHPGVTVGETGLCSDCAEYDRAPKIDRSHYRKRMEEIFAEVKRTRRGYDALVMFSGERTASTCSTWPR